MIKDTNSFASLSEMIRRFSRLPGVVGIVEYGGRTHTDTQPGGDYDLTVIFEKPVSQNFSGVHFHVNGIPVDCMLLCVNDFALQEPADSFHLVHLDAIILYDKDGITAKLLDEIQTKWNKPSRINDSQIMWIRFAARHTLDKLEHRLYDDEIYSHCFIAKTVSYAVDDYAEIKGLSMGKTKEHLSFMAENDPVLYRFFETLYKTADLLTQFEMLKGINAYIANCFGGMWNIDEILFHLTPNGENNESEQLSFVQFLF